MPRALPSMANALVTNKWLWVSVFVGFFTLLSCLAFTRSPSSNLEAQSSQQAWTVEQSETVVTHNESHSTGGAGVGYRYGNSVPLQFQFSTCSGLTNQKLQLIDGIMVGLFMGAQIVLPPADGVFNMIRFEEKMQQLFADFWCRRRSFLAFKIWCVADPPPAIVYDREVHLPVEDLNLQPREMEPESLAQFGEYALKRKSEEMQIMMRSSILRITVACDFWVHVKVLEDDSYSGERTHSFWEEFWKIEKALEVRDQIVKVAENTKRLLLSRFGKVARDRAMKLGYKLSEESIQSGYHVVHLRAEEDWQNHCHRWFSWIERRDNCMNNTWLIGNVLLSEGISPVLPVYLATGLSEIQVQELRSLPSMQSFFQVYTVVTKGMLGLTQSGHESGESLDGAALDLTLAQDAEWFIGNSISTFSALTMQGRAKRHQRNLPYNAGKMTLEEMNLRPKDLTGLIPPVRKHIKWLFTLPLSVVSQEAIYNATVAAVKSALLKAPSLIPICVTAADPYSNVVIQLVSMGVRVIYHTPTWMEKVTKMVERWNDVAEQTGFQYLPPLDLGEVVAKWQRIDLPILGLLDDFILYTDTAVLFTNDVTWKDVFGDNHEALARSMQRKMFSGPFFNTYAMAYNSVKQNVPNNRASKASFGVPKFFAVPNFPQGHSGVMLMNLRNLREYYDFHAALIKKEQLFRILSSDPCSYFEVYEGTSLPTNLGWKPHQPDLPNVSIVHFDGPNCQGDILPYLRKGHIQFDAHKDNLEKCAQEHRCFQLCIHYERYLRIPKA